MSVSDKPIIVIYGGTFNPIHNGHLFPAIESAKSIDAEKLIYLPCHIPPHKENPSVNSFHRLAMTKLALEGVDNSELTIEISDYETQLTSPSYTRQTVEYFSELYPEHKLYFLIGMDSLLTFHFWFKWQEIFSFCDLLVMQRPRVKYDIEQFDSELKPYLKNQILITSVTEVDISSSQIKSMYKQSSNKTVNELTMLPVAVQQYIDSYNLYK
jgi:nicotinate-nucleotide adenylyltransferase